MESSNPLREKTGADSIYVLDRQGKGIILPVRRVKNIVPSRNPYPSTYDTVLSMPILEEAFIPGLKDHFRGKSNGELERVIGALFHNHPDTGNWHKRRAREYQGFMQIDGNDYRNPHIGSEHAGRVKEKIDSLHSLQKLLYSQE